MLEQWLLQCELKKNQEFKQSIVDNFLRATSEQFPSIKEDQLNNYGSPTEHSYMDNLVQDHVIVEQEELLETMEVSELSPDLIEVLET